MGVIEINPVTRIEGEAKITIKVSDSGEVEDAKFHVVIFRGFERFVRGRMFYEMPAITSRICGICPVSHLTASVKTCDGIVGVEPPRPAVLLRRAVHFGQFIQSHALSFFHLSSPDFILGFDTDPKLRNIVGIIKANPELAKNAIYLRKFGQEVIGKISGKKIHSGLWYVPGGVGWPMDKATRDYILQGIPKAMEITKAALDIFKKDVLDKYKDEAENLGAFESLFFGMRTDDEGLEFYDGKLRVVDSYGNVIADNLEHKDYKDYVGEAVEDWTYMKFSYYKPMGYPKGMMRVGPLARVNLVKKAGTPMADKELEEFKQRAKERNGVHISSFYYHYARLIEILFSLEALERLMNDPDILSKDVKSRAGVNRHEAVGVVEAPRGTLFHHYKVDDDGKIVWANFIVSTAHNNLAMNESVKQVAKRYVKPSDLKEGMLNRVEAVIRAFDPCLSCATHAWGQMPITVEIYGPEGKLMDKVERTF